MYPSSSSSRKRKHPGKQRPLQHIQHTEPSHDLFIEAHEADVLSGPSALRNAQSLEIEVLPSGLKRIGDALIRWIPIGDVRRGAEGESLADTSEGIWVDRYDARLLLDVLPSPPPSDTSDRLSPTGWSDLPSDTEDTFFFDKEETDDYRRDKRRKVLENLREERLRALREEAGKPTDDPPNEEVWGGSDEEADEAQKEFMRRTATHLLSSPNPAQLEMRILANHGADPRFAFLKGRWSRTWRTAKARVRADEQQAEEAKQPDVAALGGLAGYGDSDSDEEDHGDGEEAASGGVVPNGPAVPNSVGDDDPDAAKAARRARAREWAEQRREGRT